jgi:hypothetical protein
MKKITSIILLLSLISTPVLANETSDFDYEEVRQGEVVPYDGLLFTYDGITNALVRVQSKLKLAQAEKETELKQIQVNLETIIKGKDSQLLAKKTMYENQLQTKQDAIDALQTEAKWSTLKSVGGVILGLAAGTVVGIVLGVTILKK